MSRCRLMERVYRRTQKEKKEKKKEGRERNKVIEREKKVYVSVFFVCETGV